MRTKRVGIISDPHSGHYTGMTPPDWQDENPSPTAWRKAVQDYQKWAWKTYTRYIDELGPFDSLIHLGDGVDGKGSKNGGKEQLTTDRDEQAKMAVEVIKATKCKSIYMARGTEYHTGVSEDWENTIVRQLKENKKYKVEIGNHLFLEVNGVVISVRHFIGGTSVPQGKATAVLKEQVNNDQWVRAYPSEGDWEVEHHGHPSASIFLRGHLHRNIVVDEPTTLSIVAPGLQGWTDFGAKKCPLPVHFGIMAIDIFGKPENGRRWEWYRRTAQIGQHVQVIKL